MNIKANQHEAICKKLHTIYVNKNHDYGDSFGLSFKEWGITAAMVRLSDKWNRLKTLTKMPESAMKIKDESIKDTILDMCNYLIMTYIELLDSNSDEEKKNENS